MLTQRTQPRPAAILGVGDLGCVPGWGCPNRGRIWSPDYVWVTPHSLPLGHTWPFGAGAMPKNSTEIGLKLPQLRRFQAGFGAVCSPVPLQSPRGQSHPRSFVQHLQGSQARRVSPLMAHPSLPPCQSQFLGSRHRSLNILHSQLGWAECSATQTLQVKSTAWGGPLAAQGTDGTALVPGVAQP